MYPVPTSFHVGSLVFHTYGFGLAIAAYVTYRYALVRFSRASIPTSKFAAFSGVVIISGLVGARIAHVATNWTYYRHNPSQVFSVWHGGLASFGGIALAIPFSLWSKKKWWPNTPLSRFSDALLPALVAGWALGRLLGPQFMVDGGGHLTHQWFGLRYAGQTGKRVPVPIIQALEDGSLWLGLVALQKYVAWWRRPGALSGLAMLVWGLVRATDEHFLLGQESGSGSVGVQIAGVVLALVGAFVLATSARSISLTDVPPRTARSIPRR